VGRTPDKRAEEARELYEQGMSLVNIAAKLGVPAGTVRRWKSTQNWDKKQSERSDKNERSKNKANVRNMEPKTKKKRGPDPEVKRLLKKDELTDKQKLFCIYYVKYFNGAKAVRMAGYDTTEDNSRKIASALLRNPAIREEIELLKLSKLNRAMLSVDDLFEKMTDIAFADINDYADFGREFVPVMGPKGPVITEKGPLFKMVNSVRFKESNEVDGSLISEIKVGKDGASIKLQDKMKAIMWLYERMDELPFELQEKLKLEREKMERRDSNEKARLDLDRRKAEGGGEEALAKLDDILAGLNERMRADD